MWSLVMLVCSGSLMHTAMMSGALLVSWLDYSLTHDSFFPSMRPLTIAARISSSETSTNKSLRPSLPNHPPPPPPQRQRPHIPKHRLTPSLKTLDPTPPLPPLRHRPGPLHTLHRVRIHTTVMAPLYTYISHSQLPSPSGSSGSDGWPIGSISSASSKRDAQAAGLHSQNGGAATVCALSAVGSAPGRVVGDGVGWGEAA